MTAFIRYTIRTLIHILAGLAVYALLNADQASDNRSFIPSMLASAQTNDNTSRVRSNYLDKRVQKALLITPNQQLTDMYAAFSVIHVEAQCGEFLSLPEQIWVGKARMEAGLVWGAASFSGYMNALDGLQNDRNYSVEQFVLDPYLPSLAFEAGKRRFAADVNEITSSGQACGSPNTAEYILQVRRYIANRALEDLQALSEALQGPAQKPLEELPCPTLEHDCILTYGITRLSNRMRSAASAYRADNSSFYNALEVGGGIMPWLILLRDAGYSADVLPPPPVQVKAPRRKPGEDRPLSYNELNGFLCATWPETKRCQENGWSADIRILLAAGQIETANELRKELMRYNYQKIKGMEHFAVYHARRGELADARAALEVARDVFLEDAESAPYYSTTEHYHRNHSFFYGLQLYAAVTNEDMSWFTDRLSREFPNALLYARVAIASGRVDRPMAIELLQDIRADRYSHPKEKRHKVEASYERMLGVLAKVFADHGDRQNFDLSLNSMPSTLYYPESRITAIAYGAQKFQDQKLLQRAYMDLRRVPARVTVGIAESLSDIALAEAALGDIEQGWLTASQIQFFDIEMRTKFKLLEPSLDRSALSVR